MKHVLFLTLVVMLGAFGALGMYGIYLQFRLLRRPGVDTRRQRRFRRGFITLVVGEIIRSSILLEVVIRAGEVSPSLESWLFISGLFVGSLGLLLLTNVVVEETAELDAQDELGRVKTKLQAEAERITSEDERRAGEEYRERGEARREAAEREED